ncbi:MAG TPA: 1,2-phenylacetyl-CoA epoxidase subunit PaaD [Gemmatimonadaceae bacterium]
MVATTESILDLLREVKDPELPMLDVVELGIVRDVEAAEDSVRIDITPTYSGCPAIKAIENDIIEMLTMHGVPNVTVRTVYSPAWTTDWMGDDAKEKLRVAGIAPPGRVEAEPLVLLRRAPREVVCPYCGSSNSEERSEFGSTACKAIHYCNSCQQPFDRFKTL